MSSPPQSLSSSNPSPRDTAARRPPVATALAGLALIAPGLSLISALAMAPLLTLAAILILIAARKACASGPAPDRVAPLVLALILAWAAVTIGWTLSHPSFAWLSLGRTLATLAVGTILLEAARRAGPASARAILTAGALGIAIAAPIMLALGALSRWAIFAPWDDAARYLHYALHLDRGSTVLALMLWPVLYRLWTDGRRRPALLLLAVAAPAILVNYDLAAKVALLVAGALLAVGRVVPRRILVPGLGTLLAAALLAFPLVAARLPSPEQAAARWPALPISSLHRLVIWKFSADEIALKPIAGWGYESAREIGQHRTFQVTLPSGAVFSGEVMPLHPHNFVLQIWLELGALGALGTTALLGTILCRLYRTGTPLETATLGAGFVVAFVAFGIWQSWWLVTLWAVAALSRLATTRPLGPCP